MMKQALIAMMVYLVMFGVLVIISLMALLRGEAVFRLGAMPASVIDGVVLFLSAVGVIKSIWHIRRIRL